MAYIYQKNRSAGDGTTSPEEERETRPFYIYQACDQINRSSPRNELPFFFFSTAISQGFQSLPLLSSPTQYISLITNMHVSCLTILMSLSLPSLILQSFLYEISIERIDRPQSRRNYRVMKNHKRERTEKSPKLAYRVCV